MSRSGFKISALAEGKPFGGNGKRDPCNPAAVAAITSESRLGQMFYRQVGCSLQWDSQ